MYVIYQACYQSSSFSRFFVPRSIQMQNQWIPGIAPIKRKQRVVKVKSLTLSYDVGSVQNLDLFLIYITRQHSSPSDNIRCFSILPFGGNVMKISKKYLTHFASVAGKSWRATAVETIDQIDASSIVQTSHIGTVIYICRRQSKVLKILSSCIHQTSARAKAIKLENVNQQF